MCGFGFVTAIKTTVSRWLQQTTIKKKKEKGNPNKVENVAINPKALEKLLFSNVQAGEKRKMTIITTQTESTCTDSEGTPYIALFMTCHTKEPKYLGIGEDTLS